MTQDDRDTVQTAQTVRAVQSELLELMRRDGKNFMTLKALSRKLDAPLRNRLGLLNKKNLTSASLKEVLTPCLGDRLEIRKKANSLYLTGKQDPETFILERLSETSGKSPGMLSRVLPLSKKEFLAALNRLLREGRVTASLTDSYAVRLTVPASPTAHDEKRSPVFTDRREEFKAAFDALDHGKIFVRICDLRQRLGWKREDFDEQLRRLRDGGIIQLHTGNVTLMTPEEAQDDFVDENGFRMGTVTWNEER